MRERLRVARTRAADFDLIDDRFAAPAVPYDRMAELLRRHLSPAAAESSTLPL